MTRVIEERKPKLLQKCNKNSEKQKGKESKEALFQNAQPNTDEKQEGEQANTGSYAQAIEKPQEMIALKTSREQKTACMSGTCAVSFTKDPN